MRRILLGLTIILLLTVLSQTQIWAGEVALNDSPWQILYATGKLEPDTVKDAPADTLKLVNLTVKPGDVNVRIDADLRNSVAAGGFSLRFRYDPTILIAQTSIFVDPITGDTTTAIISEQTSRTNTQNWFLYGGNLPVAGLVIFSAAGTFSSDRVTAGSGPVVRFLFNVAGTITKDTTITVAFEADPDFPLNYNTYSDSTGLNIYTPRLKNAAIFVDAPQDTSGGPPGNQPPVIDPIASPQEVTAGQSLSFTVRATDPEGGSITLSAPLLPPNASFPTVTGASPVLSTFSFSPSLAQAPDTIFVEFRAVDDSAEFGTRSVTIIIKEPPQDELTLASDRGGIPGKKGVLIPITFFNRQNTYGLQFDLEYNPGIVQIDSFVTAPILAGFEIFSNLGDSLGKVTVLIISLTGDSILPGIDTVIYVAVSIDTAAVPGQTLLDLKNGRESISRDPGVPSKSIKTIGGLFTVDRLGDVSADLVVDVQDAVGMVSYILGIFSLNTRQLDAADVNRDLSVDVGDLVGIINIILGRPIGSPPLPGGPPLASVEISTEEVTSASTVSILAKLLTPVAGAQLYISYDPSEITFHTPQKVERTQDFILQYRDDQSGNLKIVLYSFSSATMAVGEGKILSLPVTLKTGSTDKLNLKLKKVVLANEKAVVIPIAEAQGVMPRSFTLSQNYPNPFNSNTIIKFEITGTSGEAVQASLKVYNILGEKVKTLFDEAKYPGNHSVTWDGTNDRGEKIASGVYLYRLSTGKYSETKKMTLLK